MSDPKKPKGTALEMDMRSEVLTGATAWLLELGLLNNSFMKNTLYLNILNASLSIKDAEFLLDERNHKMLVYLKLSLWASWFQRRKVSQAVLDRLAEALPSFAFRVTFDRQLFDKALELLEKHNLAKGKPLAHTS